jgi:hypothetical protein
VTPVRLVALALVPLVVACGASSSATQPAKYAVDPLAPSELLPNDLDFVVRIDVRRLRNEPAFDEALGRLANASGSGMLKWVLPALEQSRALFVGGRLMGDGFHGDGVVAIETSAGGSEPLGVDPSFRHVAGTPKHVEIFERTTDLRDEAAIEVVLAGGGIVLATAAEADAVLRVARSGPDADRLDPPAHGLASFAGRLRPTAPVIMPAPAALTGPERGAAFLREIGRGLTRYAGSIEGGDALHIEAELFYTSADHAAEAATSVRSLVSRLGQSPGVLQSLADSVKLGRDSEVVRLRATVPFAVLGYLH